MSAHGFRGLSVHLGGEKHGGSLYVTESAQITAALGANTEVTLSLKRAAPDEKKNENRSI